jgi:hypothetical protein
MRYSPESSDDEWKDRWRPDFAEDESPTLEHGPPTIADYLRSLARLNSDITERLELACEENPARPRHLRHPPHRVHYVVQLYDSPASIAGGFQREPRVMVAESEEADAFSEHDRHREEAYPGQRACFEEGCRGLSTTEYPHWSGVLNLKTRDQSWQIITGVNGDTFGQRPGGKFSSGENHDRFAGINPGAEGEDLLEGGPAGHDAADTRVELLVPGVDAFSGELIQPPHATLGVGDEPIGADSDVIHHL